MDRQDERFLEIMARRAQAQGNFGRLCDVLTELANSEDYRKRHPEVEARLQAAGRALWDRLTENGASTPRRERAAVLREPEPR